MMHATGDARDASGHLNQSILDDCGASARFNCAEPHSTSITGRLRCREIGPAPPTNHLPRNHPTPSLPPLEAPGLSTHQRSFPPTRAPSPPQHEAQLQGGAQSRRTSPSSARRNPPRTTRGTRRRNARTRGGARVWVASNVATGYGPPFTALPCRTSVESSNSTTTTSPLYSIIAPFPSFLFFEVRHAGPPSG